MLEYPSKMITPANGTAIIFDNKKVNEMVLNSSAITGIIKTCAYIVTANISAIFCGICILFML